MCKGSGYPSTQIEWSGLRSLKGRDGLIVLPCGEVSEPQHEPIEWWIEIWVNAPSPLEPFKTLVSHALICEQLTHVGHVLRIIGVQLHRTHIVLHCQIVSCPVHVDKTKAKLT